MKALYVFGCSFVVVLVGLSVDDIVIKTVVVLTLAAVAVFGFVKVMMNDTLEPRYENFRWKTIGKARQWMGCNFTAVCDQTDLEERKLYELESVVQPTWEELRIALQSPEREEFEVIGHEIAERYQRGITIHTEDFSPEEKLMWGRYHELTREAHSIIGSRTPVRDYRYLTNAQWRAIQDGRRSGTGMFMQV